MKKNKDEAPQVPIVPMPIKGKPYEHQIKAFNLCMISFIWAGRLQKNMAGFAFLFDMGCGKTLTSIAVAGALYQAGTIKKCLVVAPSSVCPVWPKELERYADFPFAAVELQGEKRKRLRALSELDKVENSLKVAVINYEYAWRILEDIQAWQPDLVICDESQRIKTPNAKQSKALHKLGDSVPYKLILSGTPIQSKAIDIYSQYRFLDPSVFGKNFYGFRNRYCRMGGYGMYQIVGYQHMDEFLEKMHSIAYRVTREDALDLPAQVFENRYVRFSPEEMEAYRQLKHAGYLELEKSEKVTASTVLVKLLRLQQLTGGFLQTDDGEKPKQVNTAKLKALEDIVEDYALETDRKMVVFARFKAEIELIEKMLQKKKVGYVSIRGDVPMKERGPNVEAFQNDPEIKVFVGQIQAASAGITLHAANVMVFYSMDFNYVNYSQACARIHRIGQERSVTYIHLLVENTVDDDVMKAIESKGNLATSIANNWKEYFKGGLGWSGGSLKLWKSMECF